MANPKPLFDNARMKLVRRIHMYAGLFLSPIILVYAFSSFIFNHGSWFFNQEGGESELSSEVFSDTVIGDMPDVESFSQILIEKLNTKYPAKPWKLTNEMSARYDGPFIVNGVGPQGVVFYRLDVNEDRFFQSIRSQDGGEEMENLVLTEFHEPIVDEAAREKLIAAIEKENQEQNLEFKSLKIRRVSDLVFSATHDDLFWDVRYDFQTGQLSASPRKAGRTIGLANLLLRYHTTHTYPDQFGVRTIWAIFVDLLAALMLFWVLSGIMMWWQMKVVRRIGMIVFGSSILISTILFIVLRGNYLQ